MSLRNDEQMEAVMAELQGQRVTVTMSGEVAGIIMALLAGRYPEHVAGIIMALLAGRYPEHVAGTHEGCDEITCLDMIGTAQRTLGQLPEVVAEEIREIARRRLQRREQEREIVGMFRRMLEEEAPDGDDNGKEWNNG